jgi:antitoxin component of RelBE/YafQ-DinJ toxin-antitoxin module
VSFLDNLENNLKALESRDEGLNDDRHREVDRGRQLAVAPWAEQLKRGPYGQELMRQATFAGRARRMKVNLVWLDNTLRLEARDHRLELRPTPSGVVAVFLHDSAELKQQPVDLASDARKLTDEWMDLIDAQKRIDDERAAAFTGTGEE